MVFFVCFCYVFISMNDFRFQVNINRPDCFNKLLFLYRVLAPILESYYITACHITKDLKIEIPGL